jgi:formate hydrogenlyase subunit 3/multisubunit Na+/H+ antiporter MnhD subunit
MTRLGKFLALPPAQRALLLRAAALLAATSLACRAISFRTFRRFLLRRRPLKSRPAAGDIAWAVTVAARYIPGATCLVQGLAAESLLRRAGQPATLNIGVCRSGRDLQAHAWVESGGEVLIGGAASEAQFKRLAALED